MDVRASAVAILSLLWAAEETPVEPLELHVPEPPAAIALSRTVIPEAPEPTFNLDAVWWTAPRSEPLGRLADRWGTTGEDLKRLNPELTSTVSQGERVVVYRHDPNKISRSVGAPNRGRLHYGVPFPEGDHWHLRAYRHRSYATRNVVTHLALALESWGERHPSAMPIKLGEFSRKGGGKIDPHSSHRTGRDVDIGYVLLEESTGPMFKHATKKTLDAEATWGFLQALHATGAVEQIFMSRSVQQLVIPYAKEDLPPEELGHWFSSLGTSHRQASRAFLRHWRGHDDHMHVRFACTDVDLNCREAKKRKKRRNKHKKRRR